LSFGGGLVLGLLKPMLQQLISKTVIIDLGLMFIPI